MFHFFHGLMNSINWPASSICVSIAQLGEHCSANPEATGSNPVEAPENFFSGNFCNCLNCDSLRWSHTHFIFYIFAYIFIPDYSYPYQPSHNLERRLFELTHGYSINLKCNGHFYINGQLKMCYSNRQN